MIIKYLTRITPRHLYLFSLCLPLFALFVSLVHLKASWDDGAITAAFARTYAHSGRFALTPSSVQVEGFSSLLWLLLLSLPSLFIANPWAIVVWMKICSAIAFLLSLVLLHRIGRQYLSSDGSVAAAVLILAITITPFRESVNGMEMTFYMLLTLVLTNLLLTGRHSLPRFALGVGVSCLLLLTRFEAPYILLFLFAGFWLSGYARERLVCLAAVDFVFFAATEIWRHHVFGLWMPNTVYAKQWQPYQPIHTLWFVLRNRLDAFSEPLTVLGWPLLVVGLLVLAGYRSKVRLLAPNVRELSIRLPACMVFGGLIFGILFGQNWGHPGRMILAFLPFFVLSLMYVVENASGLAGYDRARVLGIVLAGQFLIWGSDVITLTRHADPVSIALLEREGLAADRVRILLGRPTLQVLLPDVGGAALCCQSLTLHDSALLANPYLAKAGYAHIAGYIERLNPEIVETHSYWNIYTHVYSNPLTEGYGIVGVDGMRLLVRPDLFQELRAKAGSMVAVENAPSCQDDAMLTSKDDEMFDAEKRECLVIGDENSPETH